VTPTHGGNTGNVTVQLLGTGFQTGAIIKLTASGPDLSPTKSAVLDVGVATATFDLTGATPGVRNIVITNPVGTSATLMGGFTVEQGGSPILTVDIIGRDTIRFGSSQQYYAVIQNHGTIDAANVAAFVNQTIGSNFVAPSVQGFLGPVSAISAVTVPLTALGPPNGSPTNCSSVNSGAHLMRPNDSCADLEAAKAASEAYLNTLYALQLGTALLEFASVLPVPQGIGLCLNPSNAFSKTLCDVLEGTSAILDGAIDAAENAEDATCAVARAKGCPLNCQNPSDIVNLGIISKALNSLVEQLKPLFDLAQIPVDQVKALDDQVALFQTQALALPSKLTFPTQPQPQPPTTLTLDASASKQVCGVGSQDPNAKSGQLGAGSSRFVQGVVPIGYSIEFENVASASAATQAVTVTDTLNTNLDLATLTLGLITFPHKAISPPSIPLLFSSFTTTVDLRPYTNLLVKITASLNPSTGVLTWTFQSLDPATNQPPTDPLAGFLPPGAEGSVFFTAMPKSTVTTGTVIQNTASIIFDVNAPISTPTWTNTIDNTKPTSHVNPLAATQTTVSFAVSWTGSDIGAGIQDYTVYSSDNGGPFTAWQQNVTGTSALFTGVAGHTYGFYTLSRDLVGNIEGAKSSAEAITRIVADTTPPVIVPHVTGTVGNNGWYRSNVTVTWSVSDPESGIASSTGCTSSTLTADTAGTTLTCSASNGAGLSSSVPVTIKIDRTPPVVSGMPAANCSLWPPNGKLVQVAVVTAADALSGLAPGSFTVTGTSNEPSSDTKNPEIVVTPNGSGGFVVQLQADRLGTGTGRIYTLTATANDLAGNAATTTATCTVPHDQGQ
jgi:hypothetical protein